MALSGWARWREACIGVALWVGWWGCAYGYELPQWTAEDHHRYFGAGFLPPLGEELWPREGALPERELADPADLVPEEAGHLYEEGELELPLVDLPGELPPLRVQVEQAADEDAYGRLGTPRLVEDISESLLRTYLRTLPAAYLIDPRQLLEERKARDVERFLRWHTGEGGVPIYLVILGEQERLPEFIDLGEWCRALGGEGPAALAVFPLGGPQLAGLALTPELASGQAGEGAMAILEDCIAEAMVSADPRLQIERFYVRLSLRLFWLDRSLARAAGRTVGQVPDGLAEASGASRGEFDIVGATGLDLLWWLRGLPMSMWAGASAGMIVLCGWLVRWRRHRRERVWVLAEHEVALRLGAPHCGGAGAAVGFGVAGEGGRRGKKGRHEIGGVRGRILE